MERIPIEASLVLAGALPILSAIVAYLLVRRQSRHTLWGPVPRVATVLLWHATFSTAFIFLLMILADWYAEMSLAPVEAVRIASIVAALVILWLALAIAVGLRAMQIPAPAGPVRQRGWEPARVPMVLMVVFLGLMFALPPWLSSAVPVSVAEFGQGPGDGPLTTSSEARRFLLSTDAVVGRIRILVGGGAPLSPDWIVSVRRDPQGPNAWSFRLSEVPVSSGIYCSGRISGQPPKAEDISCQRRSK